MFLHTFGCGHNVSDGEYMAGQLATEGYCVSDDFNGADCYVINSCTVKNPSEEHFVTMMQRAQATKKPVVVAGCVPQGDPNNAQWSDVSVVGVRSIDRIAYVVSEALQGNTVRLLQSGPRAAVPTLALPKVRRNKLIEIIPINVGCLNYCTYCKTKHARGDLKSWPIEEIVQRVKAVIAEGVVEIRMTSEDTGAYGIDIGTNIVELLRAVIKVLEGTTVMLRIGMSNPPYLLRHVKDVAAILNHPNVYAFVHVPVQSGADSILDVMQREYSVAEFLTCVTAFRSSVASVTIATDIICAFPGEGDNEWQQTMDLCEAQRFPVLNISRFYPRRDTPAAAMKPVPTHIAKARTAQLTEFFNTYSCNDHLLGTQHDMWITEVAYDKHHLLGHTKNFTQVLIDPAEASMGQYVTVTVHATSKYHVKGTVVRTFGASSPTTEPLKGRQKQELPVTGKPAPLGETALLLIHAAAAVCFVGLGAIALLRTAARLPKDIA